MRFSSFLAVPLLSVLAAFPVLAQTPAHERMKVLQADPVALQSAITAGKKASFFCANCHGENGIAKTSDVPNLAGQHPSYLLEQIRQFSDGRRRNEFMEGMIRAMNSDEKIGMVLFYSAQEVAHKPAADAALADKGKSYFNKTCFRCHGQTGRGNEQIARIAGQQTDYLRTTLRRYRSGSDIRSDSIMTPNTRLMTDADIDAVVAYVSAMP